MNRFILMGGCQEKADLSVLSEVIFSGINSTVNFLICLFARNKNLYNLKIQDSFVLYFFMAIIAITALQEMFLNVFSCIIISPFKERYPYERRRSICRTL